MVAHEVEEQLSLRFVRDGGEEFAVLPAGADQPIKEIKEALAVRTRVATANLWLLYGSVLLEDHMTLRESGVPCGEDEKENLSVELRVVVDAVPPGLPGKLRRCVMKFKQRQDSVISAYKLRRDERGDRPSRLRSCFCTQSAAARVSEPSRVVSRRNISDLSGSVEVMPPIEEH
mmetsp:Transcript_118935/g.165830  ORF Transcript_118935/g.165830 Transcript_118935/m.165830 type:complete len:174 (-) Transcript_118935:86-607(-)